MFKKLFKNYFSKEKMTRSFISQGDIIEVEDCGEKMIYKVEEFDIIPNNPHIRPIDWVIHYKFSYNNGVSSIEGADSSFIKYIRHISYAK